MLVFAASHETVGSRPCHVAVLDVEGLSGETPETMLRIEVTNASGGEVVHEFAALPVRIGRDLACEIVLEDSSASRRHCVIEESDGAPRLVDLGSSNGTRLGQERVSSVTLACGDVIRIGHTRIRIVDLEGAEVLSSSAPATGRKPVSSTDAEEQAVGSADGRLEPRSDEERVVRSLGRRKLTGAVGAAVVFLLVIAGAVLWFVTERRRQADEKSRPRVIPASLLAARSEIATLRAEVARREFVDAAFVLHVKERAEVVADIDFGDDTRPFRELHSMLRDRLEVETANRLADLVRDRDDLVRARDFGAVLRLVRERGRAIVAANPVKEESIASLIDSVDRVVAAGIEDLRGEVDYFERMDLGDEARRVCERGLETFAGTGHAARIRQIAADLDQRLAAEVSRKARAEEARKRRLDQLRARYARRRESAGAEVEASDLEKLLGLLRPKLGADEALARTPSVEPATVLALCKEHLTGEHLLLAARFGYGSELAKQADRLLLGYHGSRGKEGLEADQRASRLLASVRGLESVPPGGFVYSRRHGWESAPDRAGRIAVADVRKLCRKFATVKSVEVLLERFADVVGVVERPALMGTARGEVRSCVIAALGQLRASAAEKLTRRVQHTAFRRLREARSELDRRRAVALDLIFDPKIYLPENHPDWGKGDQVNGQAEVDAAVGQVRELWNSAASYAIRLDSKSSTYSDIIRSIDETCFVKLRHDPRVVAGASSADAEGGEKSGDEVSLVDVLAEIRRNLDARIDLRTYARDSRESGIYRANRKVEDYNQSLEHEDVSADDKAHVKVVNDYREMLGRRRLFIEPRLCQATRKHSAACNAAGRIWHNGPDGSPGSRAREAGFPSGVAENVAIGYANPEGIWWQGWYRASDHHRNAMGAGHSCIGYGYVGRVGTQNFSTSAPTF